MHSEAFLGSVQVHEDDETSCSKIKLHPLGFEQVLSLEAHVVSCLYERQSMLMQMLSHS